MDARLIAGAVLAVLVASCSGAVYDSSDFKPTTTAALKPVAGADDLTSDEAPDPKGDPKAESKPGAATADADEAARAASHLPPAPAAEAPQPSSAAGGLLAFLRTPQPSAAAEAATSAAEGGAKPSAAAASEDKADKESVAEDVPVEDNPPPDEVSEAELAGEQEADPRKIAVPEEPIDDGMEHDFVNVYTSRPEATEPTIEGLPGVEWQGSLILVSRTPDDDPSAFFGGDHPFARSVPGIPRQTVQAANGLLLAHAAINVSCVKPNLLNLVRRAETHFGKKVIVTSGYRSPSHNRRVRGATHSQHLYCNALDLYMPGVARDDLARYFFAQPDRGGIGLYCHTRSIHVDTGRRRQWRWSCGKRG